MEETKNVTEEELRQSAMNTLNEAFEEYSLESDDEGKKAVGLAQLFKEIAGDRNTRKASKWDLIGKIAMAGGSIAIAFVNLWMFKQATAKEEAGEIFDTKTKQTVMSKGLMGRFWGK
jgi:hypothetical protein